VNTAIQLTPPGAAAIAVVRICGPGVRSFLADHFSRKAQPLRCVHGDLRDGENVIDDPVIVVHENGETADINLHGGPWVVASTLELLKRNGFEVVEQDVEGETTLEQEMLAALPLARTEAALRMLLAQPAAWKDFLAGKPSPEALRAIMDDRCLWNLLHPPRVAIVGAPNVGKSTLANQLFAQQRSITADLPGTTRDYIGEIANIDGLPVVLIDTPGIRDSSDTIEREAIARAGREIESADLLLVVREPFRQRGEEVERFERADHALLVMNKLDVLREAGMGMGLIACFTSATTGEGIDDLRDRIRDFFGCDDLNPARPRWWTARQRDILIRVLFNQSSLDELTG
jgi:small GTP-binding protein